MAVQVHAQMLAEFEKAVADFVTSNALFDSGDRVVLAVSGGADSIALLYVMRTLKDHAVLDGNVTRVLARLFAISGDVTKAAARRRLWAAAERLLPPGKAGLFNQAMMDLGAIVCIPRGPRCEVCPVRTACLARLEGI